MGKPSSSCLKIIACGSDSAVEDEAPEAKGSGEKRGWSFRKKSTRHRVLSSSVTSENLTLGSKETSQSTTIESQTPAGPAISEKVLALEQPDEKCQPPASFELKPPKSIEPELSETLDAPEPTKVLDTEVSGTLHPPEQPELFEPEEPERVHASESPELVEPEKCASVGDSKSLNLVEQEVHESGETVTASVLEPSEQVEPKTSVSVGESESLNLEAEVPETVVASALESPQPVETETLEEVVAESLAITELKQLDTVASSQDDILEEPIVVTIQTGVRGYLAQKELAKLRSTVKLQAAIRGHLVRRQAVDTLYCMQGIVKVQSLVRARHSLRLGNDVSVNKPTTTESSTEKLLRSAFARQLLESTPKSKSTFCDPSKPNPAWTWLERWMAVSSSGLADSKTPEVIAEDVQFKEEEISPIMECRNLSEAMSESTNPEFAVKEAAETFESEKISISSDPAEEYQPSSLLFSEEKMEQPYDSTNASLVEPLEVAAQNDQSIQSDPHPQIQSGTLSNNLVVQIEEPKLSAKRMASEQVDVENTKFAYGSRKASSPAFIAAQSKFEELSSSASTASLKSPRQDAIVESHPNTESSFEESVLKEKEPSKASISEASIPDEARVNMGGSECGTELSVTSALDSPDRFEAHVAEMDLEVKYVKEEAGSSISSETLEVKANGHSSVYDSNSSASALVQEEFPESNGVPKPVVAADANQPEQKLEAVASEEHDNGEYVVLDMAAGSPHLEHKLESGASDSQVDVGSQVEQQSYKLSPEATPNSSLVTVAESQGTPSSQVSVKTKRSKVDKNKSSTKHSSHSGGKKTAAKPLLDSGVRSSGEQLSKDQKSGKRRSSFGSTKSDNIDQEPRDSTSSIKALPSYMQATESAKAKSHSPRSSPDVQDKDAHTIKKRHSLPGAVGRQGSPRVQRPTAQSPQPQAVKGNANTPPQERKWLR